jgi:hypothetical protein
MTLDELFAGACADWEKIRDEEGVPNGNASPDRLQSGVRGNAYVLRDRSGKELAEYWFGALASNGSLERVGPNPPPPAVPDEPSRPAAPKIAAKEIVPPWRAVDWRVVLVLVVVMIRFFWHLMRDYAR